MPLAVVQQPHPDRRTKVRAAIRQRVATHRVRQRAGLAVYPVEIDGAVIDMLVRTGWLLDGEAIHKRLVAKALSAMLRDTAEKS